MRFNVMFIIALFKTGFDVIRVFLLKYADYSIKSTIYLF